MRVKICGLTREVDVGFAILAGADAVGFIVGSRPRRGTSRSTGGELAKGVPPSWTRCSSRPRRSVKRRPGPQGRKVRRDPALRRRRQTRRVRKATGARLIRAYLAKPTTGEAARNAAKGFDALLTDTFVEGQHGRHREDPLTGPSAGTSSPRSPRSRLILSGGSQRRERRCRHKACADLRGRRLLRGRELPRRQGPRQGHGVHQEGKGGGLVVGRGLSRRTAGSADTAGQFVPETLVPAIKELERAYLLSGKTRRSEPSSARLLIRLRGTADAALPRLEPHGARGRRQDLPEARGPAPQRRPQDQQHARAGAPGEEDGQAEDHRRDRRRSARGRHGDGLRSPGPEGGGLHGLRGHRAAEAQRLPDAAPGCGGPQREHAARGP